MGIQTCRLFSLGVILKGITEVSYGARGFSCTFGRFRIGCSFQYSHNLSWVLSFDKNSQLLHSSLSVHLLNSLTFDLSSSCVFSVCVGMFQGGRVRQHMYVCVLKCEKGPDLWTSA